jgi:hypothetical protein
MAPIRIVFHLTCGDFSLAHAIVRTLVALEMDQEGEASSSRISSPLDFFQILTGLSSFRDMIRFLSVSPTILDKKLYK